MRTIKSPFLMMLWLLSSNVIADFWTSAVPREIHLVPQGMVLVGDYDQTGIDCASGPKAIYLPKLDPLFKEKLTLALTAKATNKKIQVNIPDPLQYNCASILATGNIPIASPYIWQLID